MHPQPWQNKVFKLTVSNVGGSEGTEQRQWGSETLPHDMQCHCVWGMCGYLGGCKQSYDWENAQYFGKSPVPGGLRMKGFWEAEVGLEIGKWGKYLGEGVSGGWTCVSKEQEG